MWNILVRVGILGSLVLMGYGLYVMEKRENKRRKEWEEKLMLLMDEAEETGRQI